MSFFTKVVVTLPLTRKFMILDGGTKFIVVHNQPPIVIHFVLLLVQSNLLQTQSENNFPVPFENNGN